MNFDEYCLEEKFSCFDSMSYKNLFSEYFGTGEDKLLLDKVPSEKTKETIRSIYPNIET